MTCEPLLIALKGAKSHVKQFWLRMKHFWLYKEGVST